MVTNRLLKVKTWAHVEDKKRVKKNYKKIKRLNLLIFWIKKINGIAYIFFYFFLMGPKIKPSLCFFQFLNNIIRIFTYFFTYMYFQKIQTILLEQCYQTAPKYLQFCLLLFKKKKKLSAFGYCIFAMQEKNPQFYFWRRYTFQSQGCSSACISWFI